MLASVYLFGELGAGYTQYLDDYTREIFKEFAKKSKANTQLLIHREDNTVYYVYIRKLHGNKYIGMCYVVSGILITAYKQLFEIFETTLTTIVTRGVILEFTEDGRITSSLEKLHLCKAEFAQVADYLKMQIEHINESNIEVLPPINYAINTRESRTYDFTEPLSNVKNAIGLYPYVYIQKNQGYVSESVKSYSNILRSYNKRIKDFEAKNAELNKRVTKAENAQRNTKWVSILGIIALVLFGVVYVKVINPNEVTKKEMGQFVYYGPIENGEPNGIGVAIYHPDDADGRKYYIGNFVNGERSDENAILFYQDGDYYYGSMKGDKWNEGVFYMNSDDSYFRGSFEDNQPYNGVWYDHVKRYKLVNGSR